MGFTPQQPINVKPTNIHVQSNTSVQSNREKPVSPQSSPTFQRLLPPAQTDETGAVNKGKAKPLAFIPVPAIDGQIGYISNPNFLAWHRVDEVVRAWLLGSLSEDILRDVVDTTTAQELWSALAQHFNKVSASRLFELQHKLQTVKKLDKSMDEYLREIKRVCEQLASIGSPVSEQMKIFATLKGLGREYKPIKTSVEGSMDTHPSLTLDAVTSRLTSYSYRLASYNTGSEVSPHMAFNTYGPAASGYQFDSLPQALATLKITDVTDQNGNEWVSDTGATSHVTSSLHHLHQSQMYEGNDAIIMGDGSFLPITHTGSTSLPSTSGNLPLNDVLVCPGIAKSLLSVQSSQPTILVVFNLIVMMCEFMIRQQGVVDKGKAQ
ncbi:PREDICTED: uncharacterized protein LOC104698850 [Camelina sativa]|uniref:Uncharacterized protein LOC104698850 n=1 Tax=Camelina sativa TaxID=90675 RepID=A0ABM0SKN2_CAMSA|nr:PREDICTED: uncharacterized protein LOC104698850 [Camelina sativa]